MQTVTRAKLHMVLALSVSTAALVTAYSSHTRCLYLTRFEKRLKLPNWTGFFVQSFAPVTLEKPKMLLPLVNVPMMDYTLEWLAACEIEEVRD